LIWFGCITRFSQWGEKRVFYLSQRNGGGGRLPVASAANPEHFYSKLLLFFAVLKELGHELDFRTFDNNWKIKA
jgi:hypothetical protein